ncbi:hypothetical protein RMATCC62417_12313 [Rhizopus microsporus]|nr:hypothetical protein RMATCC62417_12313 [Rhizopus microsporus]
MGDHLSAKIKQIIEKRKDIENNLAKLKQKSLNECTLPRGILTDAARASGCTLSFMREYLDKSAPKKNSDMWNQFVEENFDSIATEAMTVLSNEPAEERQTSNRDSFT